MRLTDSFLRKYREKKVPWGAIGYIVYKRTYSHQMNEKYSEEWVDTLERVCNGLWELNPTFEESEICELFDHFFHLRCLPAGRPLNQLGRDNTYGDRLNNCWHVAVDELDAFTFLFNQSMLGGGVGFNVQSEYIKRLPAIRHSPSIKCVDTKDCDFIVPDNREGWCELLRRVLTSSCYTGQRLHYYVGCVRPKGTRIKTFGGVASGPEELVWGIQQIARLLSTHTRFTSTLCVDIMNIIGHIVVSGNVRRTAEIAVGDAHDTEFLKLKTWKFEPPAWRAMSNNTAACQDVDELPDDFWHNYEGNGEAYGLFNPHVSKTGRLVDNTGHFDTNIIGPNPCGEQILESREPCNLADIFLPRIKSVSQFIRIAELIYKVCKTITLAPYSDPITNSIVKQNRRLGIGLTGVLQARKSFLAGAVLNQVYTHLTSVDEAYSKQLGVRHSIKLTTIKPSGTLSLLAGCTPGIHPAYARYMIRRVQFASNNPLVKICKRHGYRVGPRILQDGSEDRNVMVVEFPIKMKGNTENTVSIGEQLNTCQHLQRYWSDSAVSCTNYYSLDELDFVKKWLHRNYKHGVKTISFMLRTNHGFKQAPLERITKSEYESYAERVTPIDRVSDVCNELDSSDCEAKSCPAN